MLGNDKMPADKYRSGAERVPGCYGGFLLVTTLTSKDTGMDLKVAEKHRTDIVSQQADRSSGRDAARGGHTAALEILQ